MTSMDIPFFWCDLELNLFQALVVTPFFRNAATTGKYLVDVAVAAQPQPHFIIYPCGILVIPQLSQQPYNHTP
jgi:hypothetical protein